MDRLKPHDPKNMKKNSSQHGFSKKLNMTADSPASANRLIINSKNVRGNIDESQKGDENSEYSEFVAPNAAPSEMTRVPIEGVMVPSPK